MEDATDRLVEDGTIPNEVDVSISEDAKDKLADGIAGALNAAMDDEDLPTVDPDDAPVDDSDQDGQDDPIESDDGGDPDDQGDDDDDDDGDEQEAADDGDEEPGTSTPPAAWRRSLKARDWSDEEINSFWQMDPEQAAKTFERIHVSRNQENAAYAGIGRQLQEQEARHATEASPEPIGDLKQIDVTDVAASTGVNEDLVEALAGPVNQTIDRINGLLPGLRHSIETVQKTEQASVATEIEKFFTDAEMEPYAEVYGKMADGLTDEQQQTRMQVFELADQIRAGAMHQGRDLAIDEVLEAAHSSVAGKFQAKAARVELKKKTKKRAASVSLRPNKGGSKHRKRSSAPSRNDAERETKVKGLLEGVFGTD